MRFSSSLRTAVLFGLVALALMANGKKPIAAAQLAPPPAPPSVALSASPASVQAGQPVTLTWSSTNATSVTLEPSVGLDAVRLQIDGQLVAHYIYSAKELKALRKGGVQRIYVGNVATGDHKLDVLVDGKLEDGADFSRTGQFTFRKEVKPKLVGLTLAGPRSGNTPIALGEW